MSKSRYARTDDADQGKACNAPTFNHRLIAEIATGVGDPQCYRGKAGRPPRFGVGDRVRVKDRGDLFYNQTPGYLRGAVATVMEIVYESPAPEDEAWGHLDRIEWFYALCFRHADLWNDDSPDTHPEDTIRAEISERWLDPA